MPLLYLVVLLFFQFAGNALQSWLSLPIPGAIIGMLLFLFYLSIVKPNPKLEQASGTLIKHLPLFFIPAGVGILGYLPELKKYGLALSMAISIGTVIGFAVSLWLLNKYTTRLKVNSK